MALTKVKASNITLSTPAANSNDTTPATTAYVTTAIDNLVDSSPAALNTLNELAAALNDDASFSTTVTNSIATKVALSGSGQTIADSGNLTLDVAGDINLDADDGIINFLDGGTVIGSFQNSSSDFVIKSVVSNQDILLKGNDGGSEITALTLDMSGAGAATFNSSVTAGGDVTAFSDMRIKHDIETIEGALAKVSDMRGVYFKRNNGEAWTGVIAQEIENILPEVVKDGEYKSVAYGNMVGILIEAIKELKAEVESLKESS